jgi:hypothetical protein
MKHQPECRFWKKWNAAMLVARDVRRASRLRPNKTLSQPLEMRRDA